MKTVCITGSSRGIGFGIARAFAARGYNIVLNGRTDGVNLLAAEIGLQAEFPKIQVLKVLADMSDYNEAARLFAKAEESFGTVDILVNNAGAEHFGLFTDMTTAEITGTLANNLNTAINASHIAAKGMIKQKHGSIINISSIWGIAGASCEVVYSTAKAGLNGFTKALAKELAPSGIRVNGIACGAFDTRMNERLTADEKAEFTDNIPLGRFGNPSEVGDLAVFLASDKAAYITGQIIGMDGGFL